MINLNKLRKIAVLSLKNALRLHSDAIFLYKNNKLPSSYFLSILSQEEIGKMHMVNDFVWHAETEGYPDDFEEEWLSLIYKHPHKQHAFIRNSPLEDWSIEHMRISEEVLHGALESRKQGAVYVGLKRHKKGKIDKKGKIKHPFQITNKTAKTQITKINDYLLAIGIGINFTLYSLDNEEVEVILKNKKNIRALYKNWEYMGSKARKMIQKMQKYEQKIIINT